MSAYASASSVASAADGASASLAWPAGILAGDVVLLALALGSTTPTPAVPTGFTQVLAGVDVSTTLRTRLWYKKCDGTESGTIALSWSGGSASYAAAALRYRYVDAGSQIDASASNNSAVAGTSRATPGLTAVRNALSVHLWCDTTATGPQTWTISGGAAQRAMAAASASASRFVSILAGDVAPAGTGLAGGKTSASGISSTAFVGFAVTLVPDTSGGLVPGFADPSGWQDPSVQLFGAPVPPDGQLWPRGAGR